MNTPNNPNNPNNQQQRTNMSQATNDDSNTPNLADKAILVWTKPDGSQVRGTFEEIGRDYYAQGYNQEGHALELLTKTEPAEQETNPPGWRVVDVGPGETTDDPTKPFGVTAKGGAVCANGLMGDEDTDDEATEEAAPRAVLAVTPSVTVGQREPVTVESRAAMVTRRESAAERSNWLIAEEDLNADDVAAAQADADMLERMGLTPGRTLFAPGTPLVQWGLDKWRQERTDLDNRPSIWAAASEVVSTIAKEERDDVTVDDPSKLRLRVDGGALVLVDDPRHPRNAVRLERSGLIDLSRYYGGKGSDAPILPSARFMDSMSSEEIAELFNQRVERGVLGDRSALVMRTREASDGSGRALYGAVSTSYAVCDADEVAKMLREECSTGDGPMPRASMVYNPNTASLHFEITSMRDTPPVVGEVWKMGFKGSTGDSGGSGHRYNGMGAAFRAICCNLTTETLETASLHQRHRGHHVADKIRENIRDGWAMLRPWFAEFAGRWEVLANTSALDVLGGADMAEAIERLVVKTKHGGDLAKAAGIKRDALVQMLLQSHSHEPGESLADVVNAVTRMHRERVPARLVANVEAVAGVMARDLAGGAA